MKRFAAYLFCTLYLFSTTEAYQVLKTPVILAHFHEHQKENKDINSIFKKLAKLKRSEYIGLPVNKLKSALNMQQEIPANLMDGIPVDTANNELAYWMRSVTNAYKGEDQNRLQQMILVKGDGEALYPIFKSVKDAFKANEIFKFRIVTEGESVPEGSELYKSQAKK